jgi:hypothetical protein
MRSADPLDEAIRSLVVELVEAAPPAPSFPGEQLVRRLRHRRRLVVVALPLSLALAGAAAASIPTLLETSPGVTRLFLRSTTSGIDIRAYEVTTGAVVPYIEVGLSSSHAAGLFVASTTGAPISPDGLAAVGATVFGSGVGGGSAVLVRTGTNVATVRAVFGSGTRDTMHPIDGWAELAAPGTSASGRLLALDASGQQLATTLVPRPTRSGEGFSGESSVTFIRVTKQGVLVIGHTVRPERDGPRWLYPYFADRASVQLGLEGLLACRPSSPEVLEAGVLVAGVAEGEPMTVVVAHAGRAIARVEVRFRGGTEDSMTTVAGQAVLVTLGTVDRAGRLDSMQPATLDGFTTGGRLVASEPLYPTASPYDCCVS